MKLVILLAPRKTALACMEWSQLDDPDNPTLWTTPFELTKSRKSTHPDKQRKYLTPLPSLAQRILKSVPQRDGEPRAFPSLLIRATPAGGRVFDGTELVERLVEYGAPKDFNFHAWRHTVATWFETEGHSEWERGLVLNHASTGVTAGYSRGYPLELKLQLLTKRADHVAGLVQLDASVTVLRQPRLRASLVRFPGDERISGAFCGPASGAMAADIGSST